MNEKGGLSAAFSIYNYRACVFNSAGVIRIAPPPTLPDMPFRSDKIPCNFAGDFKVGDNLVFNCDLLRELNEANKGAVFNKTIVLQIGSIIEAALGEIIYRAQILTVRVFPIFPSQIALK
jgi:hypothetical protein